MAIRAILPTMKNRLLLLLTTTLGAVLSGIYWVLLFQTVYSLSATDTAPGVPEREAGMAPLLVGIAGLVLYVLLAWGWRWLEIRWIVKHEHRP